MRLANPLELEARCRNVSVHPHRAADKASQRSPVALSLALHGLLAPAQRLFAAFRFGRAAQNPHSWANVEEVQCGKSRGDQIGLFPLLCVPT